MKLLTIASHRGMNLAGLRFSGMTTDVERLHDSGWRLHRRGPSLFFEAPPDATGRRKLYERSTVDFDLGWDMEPGENISAAASWSSPEPEQEKRPAQAVKK